MPTIEERCKHLCVAYVTGTQTCEDLEDMDSLRHLFSIIRNAVMLNDTSLLETLMAEDTVMVRCGEGIARWRQ